MKKFRLPRKKKKELNKTIWGILHYSGLKSAHAINDLAEQFSNLKMSYANIKQ